MTREEILENLVPQMLSTIKEKEFIDGRWHYLNPYEIIRMLLNLKGKCGECRGKGKYSESQRGSDGFEKCPACEGTGQVPLLKINEEAQ